MSARICTRSEIEAVRHTTTDQTLADACGVALWNLDTAGILSGNYTESSDRVRAAIIARIDAGEMVSADGRTETTHTFQASSEAWEFMQRCDRIGVWPGYPTLAAPYTVRVVWSAL